MGLKPEISIPAGLATATLVYAIFQNATPSIADIRVAPVGDEHIAASERLASWTAAGTVSAVALIAKDPNIFIFGGAAVVALAWWHRHANLFNPNTGSALGMGGKPAPQTQAENEGGYGYGDDFLAA